MERAFAVAAVLLCASLASANPEMTVDLPGGVTMEFVWIEPGAFLMGSPASDSLAFGRERPQHRVTLSRGYWLGKYEVTQAQWQAVAGSAPWAGQDYVQEGPHRPAVYVSWEDVQDLLAVLNQTEEPSTYRLPTEAEWEYAGRAGTDTRWSFGDDEARLTDYAWYFDNAWAVGVEQAPVVGGRLPNRWGLYDMHGGVWEWVQDWYGDYSSEPQTDPLGPSSGSHRVARGGSFDYGAALARSANRYLHLPDLRNYAYGVRLARTDPVPTTVAPQTWGHVKVGGR